MGYSSSSEEEEESEVNSSSSQRSDSDAAATGGDSSPVRKKLKTESQLPKTRYVSVIALDVMAFCVFD